MEQAGDAPSPSNTIRRRMVLYLAVVVFLAGSSAAVVLRSRTLTKRSDALAVNRSPDKNARPQLKYVGDSACKRCHSSITETYRLHPMGRSLAPITDAPAGQSDRSGDQPLFRAQGLEYSIANRDGRVFHRETRRDSAGRLVAQNEAEVRYELGSGTRAVAYLIERDGFLFESPITWYARERKWDLSPGYEKSNVHFDRPIQPDCLYCHANRITPAPGTVNRYQPPIFEGHAIGCERCHGPGDTHVQNPTSVNDRDITIVNPAVLEPSLRDAVCEQCHLTGRNRVVRLDRQAEDFRPGLPFFEFWTVLVPSSGPAEERAVGQVEQMHESRCFRASQGRLGCISCHDPHKLPAPEDKVGYYRERCLQCHAQEGCRLPRTNRLAQSRDNDCTACHMARIKSSDVLHVAMTDHHINRFGNETARPPVVAPAASGHRPNLVIFHRELMDDKARAAANRDIGVALCRDGSAGAAVALPLLEAALAARPDDLAAWESKAFALGQLGRGSEAMAAFQRVLTQQPDRETALTGAAYLAARGKQTAHAIAFYERDITINPWRSEYRAELAALLFQARDFPSATRACHEALNLNPANQQVRKLLVRCYLHLQDRAAAQREFQMLLGFDPPDRDELVRWFTPLLPGER
jgi:Tfp pilus assembly protein PilF